MPLNGGTCFYDVSLNVVTDHNSGGYSAFVPIVRSDLQDGPAVFFCDLAMQEGAVGLSAVTADCRIIAERVA